MRHYRLKSAQSSTTPFLMFEIKIDMQDPRSGYRYSDWGLYLQAPWVHENDLEWTADMVNRVEPEELEEIQPASYQEWPELADQKVCHYLIKYYRPRAWRNTWLGIFSHAGESKEDFIGRCREAVRDRCDSQLKKIREVFYHRFVELEQKMVRQADQDELGEAWRGRHIVQVQDVFNELREDLSTVLLGANRPVTHFPALEIPDGFGAEAESRLTALRQEFFDKYNEVLEEYEQQASQVEAYDVPLSYSQIEIASRAFIWT